MVCKITTDWDFENGWKRVVFQARAECTNCGAKFMNGRPVAKTFLACDDDYTIKEEYSRVAHKAARILSEMGLGRCENCGAVAVLFSHNQEIIEIGK